MNACLDFLFLPRNIAFEIVFFFYFAFSVCMSLGHEIHSLYLGYDTVEETQKNE